MAEEKEEVKSFKDLGICKQLIEACDNLGWKNLIQVEAIPHALEGKDLIGLAQTGSGKTGALGLPVLQGLLESSQNSVQAFFACGLSPTRELAIQIAEQFEALGSAIDVRCAVLVGGVHMVQQALILAKRPHIVVWTPGRLMDHLSNTKGFSLRTLKYLVLYEADRLLNEDFEKSLDEILSVIPRDRNTFIFCNYDQEGAETPDGLSKKSGEGLVVSQRTCSPFLLVSSLVNVSAFNFLR